MAGKKKTNGAKAAAAGEGADRVEQARYEELLPCRLDPASLPERSAELARLIREREETLERKRETNAKYREKLAFYDERMKELAEQVEGKIERKPVECVEYLLERTMEVIVVRSDTHEVVSSRAATPEDRQEDLFDGEGMRVDEPAAEVFGAAERA